MSLETDPERFQNVGPLSLMTGLFFLNVISRVVPGPLMPVIEPDLGIRHTDAGSIFLFLSSGYFISLLGAGFVSSRIRHRGAIVWSTFTMGIALFVMYLSPGILGLRTGAFLLGLATGLYLPSAIATITDMVPPGHWGKAIAIHQQAPSCAYIAAPVLGELLLQWMSWRAVFAAFGIASIASGFIFIRFGRFGQFSGEAPSLRSFSRFFSLPSFWIMVILFGLSISGNVGVYTMLPLYLVSDRGLDPSWANTLVSLSRVSGIGMTFVAGWAADRIGHRKTMIASLALTGLTTIFLGLAPDWGLIPTVFLQPMMAVCFFPAAFAMLSAISPPDSRNVVVSLTVPAAFFLGAGAIPTGIGAMGDAGHFRLGVALVGFLIFAGGVLATQVNGKEAQDR